VACARATSHARICSATQRLHGRDSHGPTHWPDRDGGGLRREDYCDRVPSRTPCSSAGGRCEDVCIGFVHDDGDGGACFSECRAGGSDRGPASTRGDGRPSLQRRPGHRVRPCACRGEHGVSTRRRWVRMACSPAPRVSLTCAPAAVHSSECDEGSAGPLSSPNVNACARRVRYDAGTCGVARRRPLQRLSRLTVTPSPKSRRGGRRRSKRRSAAPTRRRAQRWMTTRRGGRRDPPPSRFLPPRRRPRNRTGATRERPRAVTGWQRWRRAALVPAARAAARGGQPRETHRSCRPPCRPSVRAAAHAWRRWRRRRRRRRRSVSARSGE